MSDIKELVKRLRAEEGRMVKLFDLATVCRDKHRGHASFADFNDIKHGISGRDPVLTEAADALKALERERDEARAEVARLREVLEPFAAFAKNVDESGWTSNIHREGISVWFGPSEFRCARAALSEGKVEDFRPQIIRNNAGGVADLVLRDVACVYGEQRTCRVIRDMNTGEEIGFQWNIPEDRTNG